MPGRLSGAFMVDEKHFHPLYRRDFRFVLLNPEKSCEEQEHCDVLVHNLSELFGKVLRCVVLFFY